MVPGIDIFATNESVLPLRQTLALAPIEAMSAARLFKNARFGTECGVVPRISFTVRSVEKESKAYDMSPLLVPDVRIL